MQKTLNSLLTLVSVASGAVAVLQYFGIDRLTLFGLAISFEPFLPFAYLLLGAGLGFAIKTSLDNLNRPMGYTITMAPTIDEVIESFDREPFELKVILKAAMLHGPIYHLSDCFDWNGYWARADKFLDSCNIRDGICRCTLKETFRKKFDVMPELLKDVSEGDMSARAIQGRPEVDKPCCRSADDHWWYYSS